MALPLICSRSAVLIIAGLTLSACSAQIIPPTPPAEARTVFVLDHGRHSSLVLSRPDGALVRYSYGDWRYYAENENSTLDGLRALLIPSQAALGHRELAGPAEPDAVRQQVAVVIVQLLDLQVEATAVDELDASLREIYRDNRQSLLYRPEYDLEFVHHPRSYTLRSNSNRMVAEWLQALGAEVRGSPVLSSWRLATETDTQP